MRKGLILQSSFLCYKVDTNFIRLSGFQSEVPGLSSLVMKKIKHSSMSHRPWSLGWQRACPKQIHHDDQKIVCSQWKPLKAQRECWCLRRTFLCLSPKLHRLKIKTKLIQKNNVNYYKILEFRRKWRKSWICTCDNNQVSTWDGLNFSRSIPKIRT